MFNLADANRTQWFKYYDSWYTSCNTTNDYLKECLSISCLYLAGPTLLFQYYVLFLQGVILMNWCWFVDWMLEYVTLLKKKIRWNIIIIILH